MTWKKSVPAVVLALSLALVGPARGADVGQPLALDDIKMLLANSVSGRRIALLVKEQGVDFTLRDDEAQELYSQGLDESAVQAVRENLREREKPGPQPDEERTASRGAGAQGASDSPPFHPETGFVQIETEPPGAKVFESGIFVGRTPLEIKVPAGLHVIVLVKERYRAESVPVFIKDGFNAPIRIKFIPP